MAKKAAAKRRKKKEDGEPLPPPEEQPKEEAPKPSKYDLGGSSERGRERISAWADQLGRRWGRSTALPFNVAPVAGFQFIPSGCFLFDWLVGGGLAVRGKTSRAWGPPDSYKTTTLLRTLANAQRTCRMCWCPIVTSPTTGRMDCSCPNPRWWLKDESDYIWLPHTDAIAISLGILPPNAKRKKVKGEGTVYVLECAPPPHLEGKKGVPKRRDIIFTEDYRNEPMRTAYCEPEQKISKAWAEANGVDTANVMLVCGQWAEQTIETIEDVAVSRDFDIIFLDSTSMLDVKAELEKNIQDARKVGVKAAVMTRFIQRWVAAASEEGLTGRLRPTLVTTSQVRMAGIGGGGRAYQSPTDGHAFQHGLILDVKMSSAGFQFRQGSPVAHAGKFRFDVRKNHAGGPPRAKGIFQAWLEMGHADRPCGDVGDLQTTMAYARSFGEGYILEGTGKAKLTLYSPFIENNEIAFASVGDCTTYLRENESVYRDLRFRTLAKCRAECEPPKLSGDD
jgi:RecA/RadA recombinase